MSKLRPLKPKHILSVLNKLGFRQRRQTGSHLIFRHDQTGKIVVVPMHGNKDIKTGTLRSIIRQSGLSIEEFFNLFEDN